MKPAGHSAVMASRSASAPDALDYFPTPIWAARAGGELIDALDSHPPGVRWSCWEPACGEGHMAHGLADYFREVRATDIFDYGFGDVADFLDGNARVADWIVTNPPFKLGEQFVRTAWPLARRGVAMLLRLAFLEGGARHSLLTRDCPLTVCAPFAERVPMVKGRWDPDASSATAYAWFIWRKGGPPRPTELHWIPPGTKARLSRPADVRAFGAKADAPLFDEAAA